MLPIILQSSDIRSANSYIKKFSKSHNISDIFIYRYTPEKKEFSIAQVREIKKSIKMQVTHNELHILYEFDTASIEAQNALLKTLEEHSSKLQFILQVTNGNLLLPTIQSRAKVIILDTEKIRAGSTDNEIIEKFIKSDYGYFNTMSLKKPLDLLKQIMRYYQNRLSGEPQSVQILREAIDVYSQITKGSISTQIALDHLFVFISKFDSNE